MPGYLSLPIKMKAKLAKLYLQLEIFFNGRKKILSGTFEKIAVTSPFPHFHLY